MGPGLPEDSAYLKCGDDGDTKGDDGEKWERERERCLSFERGAQIKLAGMTTSLFEDILHMCWRDL